MEKDLSRNSHPRCPASGTIKRPRLAAASLRPGEPPLIASHDQPQHNYAGDDQLIGCLSWRGNERCIKKIDGHHCDKANQPNREKGVLWLSPSSTTVNLEEHKQSNTLSQDSTPFKSKDCSTPDHIILKKQMGWIVIRSRHDTIQAVLQLDEMTEID